MKSTSTIGMGDTVRLLPETISPAGWERKKFSCADPDLTSSVCAKPLKATLDGCDDARTPITEKCAKPLANLILKPASLTARPLVKRSAMRLSSPP